MVASLSAALLLGVLWLASLWLGAACFRRGERWAINTAEGTQALHGTTLAFDLSRGCVKCTQTRTLSQIGAIGSVLTGPPDIDWDGALFSAGSRRERSWDRHWFAERWNHWRLGDLGWYESAGGASISRVLSIPLWLLMLVTGLPGVLLARSSMRSAQRRARGQCIWCGYQLKQSQPACPECGRKASANPPGTAGGPLGQA